MRDTVFKKLGGRLNKANILIQFTGIDLRFNDNMFGTQSFFGNFNSGRNNLTS